MGEDNRFHALRSGLGEGTAEPRRQGGKEADAGWA